MGGIGMKKNCVRIILLSFIAVHLLAACSSKGSQSVNGNIPQKAEKKDELKGQLKLYKDFLQDKISSEDRKDKESHYLRDYCNVVVPEEDKDGIRYDLFDMTGDGIPELHVLTDISYSVHTIEGNRLVEWFDGDRYCRPLDNGAILQQVDSNDTTYIVLNAKGEEVFWTWFGKSGNDYRFSTGGDDVKLSKSQWEKLTEPFLSIGSDEITWKAYTNIDF